MILLRPVLFALSLSLTIDAFAQKWVAQSSGVNASLRGICAPSRDVVWASGAGGTWLRSTDAGSTWHTGTVPDASGLDFRAVHALDANRAWLMSAGPGEKSRLFHTTGAGAQWSLLYTNPDAAGFFDALAFWDARRGVILGDPVNGQFVVLVTADGGHTWQRRKLPPALPNEGAFAASNSSLVLRGRSDIWFATGGPSGARIFHSADAGLHWQVGATPLRHDGAATGIFSLSFADSTHALAAGGDYEKPADSTANLAITSDAGLTWSEPPASRPHGYRSAIAYLSKPGLWLASGTSGSDLSRDGGHTWIAFDAGAYNAIATFGGDSAWAVGPSGRIAKLRLDVP